MLDANGVDCCFIIIATTEQANCSVQEPRSNSCLGCGTAAGVLWKMGGHIKIKVADRSIQFGLSIISGHERRLGLEHARDESKIDGTAGRVLQTVVPCRCTVAGSLGANVRWDFQSF